MPPPNAQCTTLEHYAIVQGCFNISSDTLMLFIPLPLVFKMKMQLKQKLVLLFIFSMGMFVIVAALLTKIFNLTNIWDPSYMLWYVREASVAIYVSNLPMVWPLLREWFPILRGMTPGGSSSRRDQKYSYDPSLSRSKPRTHLGEAVLSSHNGAGSRNRQLPGNLFGSDDLELGLKEQASRTDTSSDVAINPHHDDSDSSIQIVEPSPAVVHHRSDLSKIGGIQVERTITVQEELSSASSGHSEDVYDWSQTGRTGHKADASRG
jgi:hypothetical protein